MNPQLLHWTCILWCKKSWLKCDRLTRRNEPPLTNFSGLNLTDCDSQKILAPIGAFDPALRSRPPLPLRGTTAALWCPAQAPAPSSAQTALWGSIGQGIGIAGPSLGVSSPSTKYTKPMAAVPSGRSPSRVQPGPRLGCDAGEGIRLGSGVGSTPVSQDAEAPGVAGRQKDGRNATGRVSIVAQNRF